MASSRVMRPEQGDLGAVACAVGQEDRRSDSAGPVCQPSRVAEGDRERTGIWRDDCTQATKRHAPRRTVMITADCVPCLFRQMGARHCNGPGRRIRRGWSGRYHCSSGPCWPVMTREDPGERAVARTVHFQRHGWSHVLGLSWGFAGGRCWVRTNVGLADGFTDGPPSSPCKALTCDFTVTTRSCRDGVPSRFRAVARPPADQIRDVDEHALDIA
jgi:hypothetical protein